MNKPTVKKILRLLRPYRLFIVASLLLAFITAAAQLLIPIFSGKAIDAMPGIGSIDLSTVVSMIVWIAATAIVGAVAQKLLALSNNHIAFSVSRDLREKMNRKLHALPLSYLDSHAAGDTLSRMLSDVDTLSDGLLASLTQLFTGVVTILTTLVIMFLLNPIIAVAVMILTPLSIFVARFIATRTHRFFKEQAKVRGEETALVNELIQGQKVIRSYGQEDTMIREFDEVNERLRKASLNATFFSSLTNPSTRLVNNIVYAVIALIGALFAISERISVGDLSIFLSYASQYAKPFNEISAVITELQNAFACASRVFEFIELPEETETSSLPVSPPRNGNVTLSSVDFSYTPERPLIEDLSLDVLPGQHIAIVGPTGCGKTTLINLLMRFYDVTSGSISVDHADIRTMTREDLRTRYGMVLQDTWLATGTVRENIAYGNPDATDEEIVAAAKAAHVHSTILRMKNGYDTKIAENGAGLSAGEKQLLCIARAMLSLPTMLILDEATSSIDTRTEQKIQSAFLSIMKGKTAFIVAHRLSTIKGADTILVMKDGKVIEKGDHTSLLSAGGFYATLYNSQFGTV